MAYIKASFLAMKDEASANVLLETLRELLS